MATRPEAPPALHLPDLSSYCRQNDIVFLGVFGSFARGDFTAQSDVDLLVRFSRPQGLLAIVRMERELADRLHRPVDLLTEGALSPYLKDRILAETRPLYERP